MKFTYAIGDVHGRADLLALAMAAIPSPGRVIMLGDYVDRGPESRQVIEYLMENEQVTCLKGNHEQMMIDAWNDGRDSQSFFHWTMNDGYETLDSYGGKIPAAHIEWLQSLPVIVTDDHRAYVHAGIMPGTPIDQQEEESCLWIRERFLRATDLPIHVVHGHTPIWAGKPDPTEPELLAHRTNLDTAAYHSGVLAIGVFDHEKAGGPVEVIKVRK